MTVIFDDTPVESVICIECGKRCKWKQKCGRLTPEQIEEQKKKFVCGRCEFNKKRVTNKWYDPMFDKKSKAFIGKFSISGQEFNLLVRKYTSKGMSFAEAKKKVAFDIKGMSQIKYKKRYEEEKKKMEERKKKEINENFVKGLNQKTKPK